MEDDDPAEWAIQEYSPYTKQDKSYVKWILEKGYGIGKNMVIIGVAISSAPIIVPPLIVFSAMGYAFSVPFGVGFATYACTNKIMTTLLPPLTLEYYEQPKHQRAARCMFELDDDCQVEQGFYIDEEENEVGLENVVEQENNDEDLNQGVGIVFESLDEGSGKHGEALIMNVVENVDEESNHLANEIVYESEMDDQVSHRENVAIQEEEKEQMEDIKKEVEIVFELDEGSDDYGKQGEASIMNADEGSNHANEHLDEKEIEQHVVQRNNVVIDEEEKEQMKNIKQGADIVFDSDEGGDDFEKQGEASNINVEDNADEGSNHVIHNVDGKEMEDHVTQRERVVIEEEEKEQMEDIKQGVEMRLRLGMSGEDQGYEGGYLEGDEDCFEDESKGEQPLIESEIDENNSNTWEVIENEMEEKAESGDGLSENIRDEGSVNNTVEDDYLLDESALVFEDARDVEITEPVMVKEIDSQKLIMDGCTNNETVVGEMRHIVILAEGNEEDNLNVREVEELDMVAREIMGDTNKKARNTKSDVIRESMGTQEEKTGAILRTKKEHIYADAREIGDESGLDLLDERNTNIHFASLEAYDEWKENIADENVDFVALPAFKPTPLATENGKAVSKTKTNTKMPSREDGLGEEGIWEKIEAMRTIVGYKAPSQPACIGELKALYVFTGVEPPASFKDDSDLDEVNAKLKFLMSIVGVK